MSLYLALPMVILIAMLQSVLGAQMQVLGVMPDLALLFAIAWILQKGMGEGLSVALVGGLVIDILSATPFGLATLAFVLSGFSAGVAQKNVFGAAWYLPHVTGLWATLLYNLVLVVAMQLGGRPTSWPPLVGRLLLPLALVNTLCMLPIFGAVRWLSARLDPQPVEWQ